MGVRRNKKGMYGLPQSLILAQNLLEEILANEDMNKVNHTRIMEIQMAEEMFHPGS